MSGRPNNDRWDCGGECIHGGLVGPGRECDDCWASLVIGLPRDSDAGFAGDRNGLHPEGAAARAEGIAHPSPARALLNPSNTESGDGNA